MDRARSALTFRVIRMTSRRVGTHLMSDRAIHLAIFKWKEGAPIDQIEQAFEEQRQHVTSEVPGVRSLEWGLNRSPFGKGYTHALLVVADDQKGIDAYRQCEVRLKARELFHQWREHDISADFGKE